MNLFALSGLLIGISCAILGAFTLIKGKRQIHYIWAFFSFSVALWGFGSYEIGIAQNPETALFWWRIAYVGVILIPIFFAHFVYVFLGLPQKKLLLICVYFLGLFFLAANLAGDLFINKVRFVFNQFYYISSPTYFYTLFVFLFFVLIIYIHIRLLQALKITSGVKKNQIGYFILATIPGFSAGFFEFLPVYKIDIYPYFHFIIALSPIVVAYAIMRYRLMDIRIVARKTLIYFVSAAFAYGFFYFLIWFYNRFLGGVFTTIAYATGLFIAPIFVLVFIWFYNSIQKIANKYFFYTLYNYQQTINNLSQQLNYLNDLDEIVGLIVDTLKQAMQLDRVGVLLIDQSDNAISYKIAKVMGFNEQNGISLVQDSFLTRYLQENQKPLVREEFALISKDFRDVEGKKKFLELESNMKRIEASVCLPLMSSNKLIGIIVLGSKISKDAYTSEDLELLSTLAYQAGIAIDNARLYKEIQDFNKTLQEKVDEQTKEIKDAYKKVEKAYEVEKRAHKELKRLDEAKSQFMLATQHHLRTPLTSMQGYLDLLLGGSYGKISKKVKETLEKFQKSTENEIKIVEELLNISQFQLGKKAVILFPNADIENILNEIIEELKPEAEKKGIYLKLEKPDKLPKIKADRSKLKVALFNIIDNAVKYTEIGGVTVKLEIENSKLRTIIKDTGIGIDKEEAKNLFVRIFERSKTAQKLFATGRGIGLYISAKIIQAHNGKIWAESGGLGKGSAFYVELLTE